MNEVNKKVKENDYDIRKIDLYTIIDYKLNEDTLSENDLIDIRDLVIGILAHVQVQIENNLED